jgi:hypothetical protein
MFPALLLTDDPQNRSLELLADQTINVVSSSTSVSRRFLCLYFTVLFPANRNIRLMIAQTDIIPTIAIAVLLWNKLTNAVTIPPAPSLQLPINDEALPAWLGNGAKDKAAVFGPIIP